MYTARPLNAHFVVKWPKSGKQTKVIFMNKQHFADDYLQGVGAKYPDAWNNVNEFRQGRGKDLPDWPEWCFMPLAAWYSIVSAEHGVDQLTLLQVSDVAKIAAIGTWRYTKGVYQFHPDVFNALKESIVKGALPSDVLIRLPEWCLFVETPEMHWQGAEMDGFFVHLECDAQTQRTELRFLISTEDGLVTQILHVGNWTITEAIDRAVSEAAKQGQLLGFSRPQAFDELPEITAAALHPLVSMVLYLCSEEPEIGIPGQKPPKNPNAKRTKKGWKLFPADHPRFFKVGEEIGEKLSREYQSTGTHNRPKPHIRKAHWHGFWKGAGEEKQFKYKWLPPLFINADLVTNE